MYMPVPPYLFVLETCSVPKRVPTDLIIIAIILAILIKQATAYANFVRYHKTLTLLTIYTTQNMNEFIYITVS